MTLHIRPATDDDLPAILSLYAQPGLDNGRELDLETARRIHAEFKRYPAYRLFVACDGPMDGKVVGSFALLVMHNLAHGGTPSAIVEDVVVAPERQGQGVGRQMMAHAMDMARQAGCYKLALSSNSKRQGAHAFYESLGFSRHGYSFVIEI